MRWIWIVCVLVGCGNAPEPKQPPAPASCDRYADRSPVEGAYCPDPHRDRCVSGVRFVCLSPEDGEDCGRWNELDGECGE